MKGDGRVYDRPGKSPYWWIGYYADGAEQREPAKHIRTGKKLEATEANHREAERYLKHRIEEVIAAKRGGPTFVGPKQQRIKVSELLGALERDFRLRDKWGSRVESAMKVVRDYFGSWRAVEVTSDGVDAFIEQKRDEGYANATINRWTQLLGQAFKRAIHKKQLAAAPLITRLSEVGNERQGFFETDDFEEVVERLPDYLQDFVRFGFNTGWRKGSVTTLRWPDVGEDVIYLRAENVKTKKPDTMPLEGELADIIERRRAAKAWHDEDEQAHISEYVFHLNGQPIGDFRKAWATACCAAGVGKLVCRSCDDDAFVAKTGRKPAHGPAATRLECVNCHTVSTRDRLKFIGPIFHDFRRTAGRNMIRAGVPQAVAMKITGHRTDAMFRRYAIVNEDQKREALARTQEYVKSTPGRKVFKMAAAK